MIRYFPEQVFVPQRRVENPVDARAIAPKLGAIEVLAQPRHKGSEYLWAVDVNPLPIDCIARSLASFEQPRPPIEIGALCDVEDRHDVLKAPLKTRPHHKIAKRLRDGRRAGHRVLLCRD